MASAGRTRTPQIYRQSRARAVRGRLIRPRYCPALIVTFLELRCAICPRTWDCPRPFAYDLRAPQLDVEHVPLVCEKALVTANYESRRLLIEEILSLKQDGFSRL